MRRAARYHVGMRALVVLSSLVACGAPAVGPAVPRPAPVPEARRDPINRGDVAWLRAEAGRVFAILVAALPADQRARVAAVTLDPDGLAGEVNAYAACAGTAPYIAVSDDLLRLEAELAIARATDARFATDRTRAYLRFMAGRPDDAIVAPPPGFYDPAQHADRDKLVLQRAMFDEQLAYVVGHELAHHALGHVRCAFEDRIADDPTGDLGRIIPAFHQAAELAADVAATQLVLAAGRRYGWTEEGALVLFDFLTRWHVAGIADVLLAFERTHPFAQLRQPIVMSTADLWRLTHGVEDR